MRLQRLYESDPRGALRHKATGDPLRVRNVIRVQRAPDRQRFSTRLLERAQAEGWLSFSRGKIVLHGEDGDVTYRVERGPGYYCCRCEARLAGGGESAQRHVKGCAGTGSDPSNPSGYRRDLFYEAVREGVV